MTKLSDLIKKENCFVTVDGKTLKTISDLKNYLSTCSETDYSYHVSASKNDFVSWVREVLVNKELAEKLSVCVTLYAAINVITVFLKEFDYQSKQISDDMAFHTRESFNLKNIQELYYYINNCSDSDFGYHVTSQKNDFANWVNDVLNFPGLAIKMRQINTRIDTAVLLKHFLLNDTVNDITSGLNTEYAKYVSARSIKSEEKKDISKLEKAFVEFSKDESSTTPKVNAEISNEKLSDIAKVKSDTVVVLEEKKPEINSTNNAEIKKIKTEETIDLTVRPNLEPAPEIEKTVPPEFDMSGFRQFTDEELEKFILFSKKTEEVPISSKVEYLKSTLQELHNMIRDLRRIEKDPLIADLMLRTASAKIDYYALSNNVDDYNHIIRLFKDVQHEIEECATQQSYNLAEEIFNNLKFQTMTLKKA